MPTDDERPTGIEYRTATETWPLEDMEFRAAKDGLRFSGYAAVFNSESRRMRFGVETIRPGAFHKSIGEQRARKLFINHQPMPVLASTAKGTLRLTEDKRGLLAEADLPDNEWGRPVADAIRRGDIDSMSFAFDKIRDDWAGEHRTLIEVKLNEVSIVTDHDTALAAYSDTTASVRTMIEELPDELRSAIGILGSADERLNDEQIALLLSTIDEHRAQPTTAERLALWRAEFAPH
jgi:HK97 family phage prohead protease